jgi:hypothetical protein
LQRRKTRTRQLELGAALAAALCLAGCGAGAERRAAPQPKLPRPVAAALAQRSDAVADALGAGDDCTALTHARALQQQTIAAINAGRVPGPLQEPLQTTVNDLARRIRCVAPPPVEDEDRGRGKGKGKGKKHGEGDD